MSYTPCRNHRGAQAASFPCRRPPLPATLKPASPQTRSASAKSRTIDPDARQMMIAEAAYYLAEKRGFTPGGELQDWLDAEAQIETSLRA